MAKEAEDFTQSDLKFGTEKLESFTVIEFQNLANRLIAQDSLPIWEIYFGILFDNTNICEQSISLHRKNIYYVQRAVPYIMSIPNELLEFYVWWSLVDRFVSHTTSELRQLRNNLLNKNTPRSFYCTSQVNRLMGMAVSYTISEPNFLKTTKPDVLSMINNIRMAFHDLVSEAQWMDYQSKCSTHEKLNALQSYVGFPEWILKAGELDKYYVPLALNKSTHVQNMIDVLQWRMTTKLKYFHTVEDLAGLVLTATNVNAFHISETNTIGKTFQRFQFLLFFSFLSSSLWHVV